MIIRNNFLAALVGRLMLVMGGAALLLFLANLRSRIYYHGPNYSFLFWIVLYCLITGIGLLKLKKWAVLLLYVPGVLLLFLFIDAHLGGHAAPMPWALVNYGFLATVLLLPTAILREWDGLRW